MLLVNLLCGIFTLNKPEAMVLLSVASGRILQILHQLSHGSLENLGLGQTGHQARPAPLTHKEILSHTCTSTRSLCHHRNTRWPTNGMTYEIIPHWYPCPVSLLSGQVKKASHIHWPSVGVLHRVRIATKTGLLTPVKTFLMIAVMKITNAAAILMVTEALDSSMS